MLKNSRASPTSAIARRVPFTYPMSLSGIVSFEVLAGRLLLDFVADFALIGMFQRLPSRVAKRHRRQSMSVGIEGRPLARAAFTVSSTATRCSEINLTKRGRRRHYEIVVIGAACITHCRNQAIVLRNYFLVTSLPGNPTHRTLLLASALEREPRTRAPKRGQELGVKLGVRSRLRIGGKAKLRIRGKTQAENWGQN